MNKLDDQITRYQDIIKELSEEFDSKHFYSEQLTKQTQQAEEEIKQMLSSLERDRHRKAERQFVLKNKLSPHPFRNIIELRTQNQQSKSDHSNKQALFNDLITQNCRIQLQIRPIKMHSVYNKKLGDLQVKDKIPSCAFRFILFHGEKMIQLGDFKYNSMLNIHNYQVSAGKLGIFLLIYELTFSTYQMFGQMLRQQKIYIFLENEFRMITAIYQTDISDIIDDNSKLINNSFVKMLRFKQIGTNKQMFYLQCMVHLRKYLISPQMIQLKQKMHVKRVLSKSPTRNRSPSPRLHKKTAQSLLKGKQKVVRMTIMQNRETKLLVYKKSNESQKFRHQIPKIDYSENIVKYTIDPIQQGLSLYLNVKIDIENGRKQGFMQIKMDYMMIKITIKENKLFRIYNLTDSRKIFKTAEDCKNINAVIKLTQYVYIRPEDDIKVIESLSQHKISKHSIISYNLKSNLKNPSMFFVQPARMRKCTINQNGIFVQFGFDGQWLRQNDQLQVVIAIREDIQRQQKPQTLLKQILRGGVERNLKTSIDPKELKNQKIIVNSIQLHVINYRLIQLDIQINLQLDVDLPGLYRLDTKDSLPTKGRLLISSSNQTILRVVKYQFDADKHTSMLDVQLMHPIDIKANVILIVNNLTDNTTMLMKVELNQPQYWKRYKKQEIV